ncbi:4-phosphoerythronate dehydrogenase [Shewanella surugensis]|uniref:Erythronate-4-phosphate dehydrogenase n=1 Tax=Shewanella surugensis TaxID=212020 RepID=A0ABT0LK10_9GAMM|nr:4-phosphoerythronate dehydrogenase [Shewanella surugensis]MCL1127461.1 4-phosphoerythronate dehydrogenase [Shewanella surugensis]
MKIIADENMPYVDALFSGIGDIEKVNGRTLRADAVEKADVLLVRSVTKVNAALLEKNTRLKFVGSATIGTDHIDLDYLAQRGIPFANAPGCNATAVGEFVFIALLELAQRFAQPLKNKTVGIVGAGNTGTAVAKCLTAYGVNVLLHDPLLQKQGDIREFVSLETVITTCDVISLHVPMIKSGPYPTQHLFDKTRLLQLATGTWLINCCRGDVIDNKALLDVKINRPDLKLVLDVWEGEPHPLPELVPLVELATPHIAGYSLEGRARGSLMLYEALIKTLGYSSDKPFKGLLEPHWIARMDLHQIPNEKALLQLVRFVYDLRDDDRMFRNQFLNVNGFDHLRKIHQHRRELSTLTLVNSGQLDVNWLFNLGFSGIEL